MSKILVIGSVNMDLVVRTPRFARPGETLMGLGFDTVPGGKGANQAVAACRLGGSVAMVACVGEDAFGRAMREGLAEEGIDVQHVDVRGGHPSGVALITVDDRGENTIVVVPGANARMTVEDVALARPAIAAAAVLVLQLEVPMPVVHAAAAIAREHDRVVVLNAAPAQPCDDVLLALVDYLVVNETEVFALAGPDVHRRQDAIAALQRRGVRHVVVTLGAHGAVLASADGDATTVAAFAVPVVDTTAAGDAFVGAFAVALAEGASATEALTRGNAAGALTVTRAGAQPSLPTRAELDAWLDRNRKAGIGNGAR